MSTAITPDQLRSYKHRICVAGSRGFNDAVFFDKAITAHLKELDCKKEEVIFISGAAKTGADDLIIKWAKLNGYACAEYHPKWDVVDIEGAVVRTNRQGKQYNVLAGFWRNEEMAEVMTELITFYDGQSSGTKDMIDRAEEHQVPRKTILVNVERD